MITILFFMLFTKHLIVDFFLQSNWMAFNKGNWKHPGGYVHALLHGSTTAALLLCLVSPIAIKIGALETVAHFLIDFSKVNLCKKFNWHYKTHPFWWALGVDQYLHSLCYLAIVYFYITQ